MPKIWVIVLGVAVAAVAAAAVYLNVSSEPTGVQTAEASEPEQVSVDVGPNEHIIGDVDAPVTIIEYASLTCPHCANFHTQVLPEVKEQLLDTGKARLVYRDFPLDQLALRAAALVRCAQPLQRSALLGLLFKRQESWAASDNPMEGLDRIGNGVGMSSEAVEQCLQDQDVLDAVIAQRLEGEQKFNVSSTPSFIIGGKLYSGGLSADEIAELVAEQTP